MTDLFTFFENAVYCDHLPVSQHRWEGNKLICGKCNQIIRVLEEQRDQN